MRDFQEFINEKIAVRTISHKENIEFVALCELHGLKLRDPNYLDNFNSNKVWTVGRGFKDEIFNDNDDKNFLTEYKIVKASEFLQPQATIEIFQSKQTVVCLKKQDGKVIARGVARCSKDDEFNFEYGSTLAFKRMFVDSKKVELPEIKTLKDGTKIIKQDKYEVGDKVLIKKRWKSKNHVFEMDNMLNKIVDITRISETGRKAYKIDQDWGRWDWEHKDIKGKVIE